MFVLSKLTTTPPLHPLAAADLTYHCCSNEHFAEYEKTLENAISQHGYTGNLVRLSEYATLKEMVEAFLQMDVGPLRVTINNFAPPNGRHEDVEYRPSNFNLDYQS